MVSHHQTSRARIREGAFSAADLESEPGLAEATLAFALTAYESEDRKRIKARIKSTRHPVLNRLLKALPRRNYRTKPARVVEDCTAVVAVDGGLSAPLFAYYVSAFVVSGNRYADRYVAENASPQLLRAMLPATVYQGYARITQPWPPATLGWLAELDGPLQGFGLKLAAPAELPVALARREGLQTIRIDGEHPLAIADGLLSELSSLTSLNACLERVPADIGQARGLEQLRVRGPFTELPDLTGLSRLRVLRVSAPLQRLDPLPPGIEELSLSGLRCPLPEQLGALPALKTVSISRMHLEALPTGWLRREELNLSQYKLTTGESLGGAARRALGLPGTDSLTDAFDLFLEPFGDLLELPEPGGVARPEVLVAVSRTYIDVEHGADTNDFLASQVRDLGGPVEVAANQALRRVSHIRDEASLAGALAQLEGLENFDGQLFADSVRAILNSDWHRTRVGDWF